MDWRAATALIDRLHAAQNEFYAAGGDDALRQLLAPDIVWTVPGDNQISGTYRGHEEVFDYFARRRDLADSTFRMHRRDILVGDSSSVAALTDGTAMIAGRERHWSTVGLYEVRESQIAACWLFALDQAEFDSIWSP